MTLEMDPKAEPESLQRLKRKRGQFRFRAREAFAALKSRVEVFRSVDVASVELWQIPCLEEELQSVETRVEAFSESHVKVQCAGGDVSGMEGEEDEDTLVVHEFQRGLLSIEQEVRTFRHQCEALFSNHATRVGLGSSESHSAYRINTSLRPDPLTFDVTLAAFHVWKQKFHDFYMSNGMDLFSVREQRAQLRGCMDVAMVQTISQYMDVSDEEPVFEVLDKIQTHTPSSF
ncbi:uncharacterized protein LOC131892196 [Tigriopus californicus]|uniref:uncharacterized protein LOC131892196 n=1 Tax=Tigriopus californicus TaxID=6832 RepID=UPI0027D9DDE8|nr:uncharacterized protein LOC131892196 [Tigriopus californicus]